MGSMQQAENGTSYLLPYAMPRSLNWHGETEDQGRYCIAYSRDGWFVLDTEKWTIMRWCVDESDAIRERDLIVYGPAAATREP